MTSKLYSPTISFDCDTIINKRITSAMHFYFNSYVPEDLQKRNGALTCKEITSNLGFLNWFKFRVIIGFTEFVIPNYNTAL